MPFGFSRPEMRQHDCAMLLQGCFFPSPGLDSTQSSRDALVWEKAWRNAPCQVLPACTVGDHEHGAEGCSTGLPSPHPSRLEGRWGGSAFGEGASEYSCPGDVGWWKRWPLSPWVSSLRPWESKLAQGICLPGSTQPEDRASCLVRSCHC